MPKPKIRSSQRDGLHELVLNHLAGIGDVSVALEQQDDPREAARLAREYCRDFRLLADIGWEPVAPPGRAPFELTMPEEELRNLLARLAREGTQLLLGSTGSIAEDAAGAQTEQRIESGCRAAIEIGEQLDPGGLQR